MSYGVSDIKKHEKMHFYFVELLKTGSMAQTTPEKTTIETRKTTS
jgi:hypothetical protein